MRTLLLAAPFAFAAAAASACADEPPVFSQAGFDADRAAAIEQDRLHLVYATAVWCPPCQRMKKTTWTDPAVEAWAGEHAVITPLDVDGFPEKSQELRVRAMPTMMLFDGDEEIGRRVGYVGPDDLVAWMDAGLAGEPLPEPTRAAPPRREGADQFIGTRYHRAAELYFDGDMESATREFVRVWPEIVENDRYRRPPVGNAETMSAQLLMQLIADEHGPARDAFRELRDADTARLEGGDVSWATLTSWVYLNAAIRDDEALLAWARRIMDRGNADATLARFSEPLKEAARDNDAWDVIAGTIPDPVQRLRTLFGSIRVAGFLSPDKELSAMMAEPVFLSQIIGDEICAALHTNDDGTAEAELIAYLSEFAPDQAAWRMAFILAADRCGKLCADHTEWIEQYGLDERFPTQSGLIGTGI
ncbi:MAG: thioredoxin family protein [Planctomycetota bacterium]